MHKRDLEAMKVGAFVSPVNTNNQKYKIESVSKDAQGNFKEVTIVALYGTPPERKTFTPLNINTLVAYKA